MKDNVYKIVKIPSEYEVVINAGKNKSISVGDEFEIYEPGEEIFDPDTKESLGILDYIKDTVQAVTVLEKLTICKHITTSPSNLISTIASLTQSQVVVEKLNVNYDDLSQYPNDPSKKINLGDAVRLIKRASTNATLPLPDDIDI